MAYLGKTPSQATRARYYYTATGGETSLSGSDDNGNTLVFSDGNYVDVMLNGVTLVADTDYNTTTANTIGGLTALTASDVVEVVVYDTFSVFGGNVLSNFSIQNGVLSVDDGTESAPSITNNGDTNTGIFFPAADTIAFTEGGSEAARIDDSGNLLVGKTSASSNNVGFEARNDGLATVTRDDERPFLVNRQTSDGDIIELRKDGSTVGSIGTQGGDLVIHSSAVAHCGLRFTDNPDVLPTDNSGSITDDTVSLGRDVFRFNNLYLSGGVYLGGTGAANKLDDYEEGTFTPKLVGSSGGEATYSYQDGSYVKIGNQVFINVSVGIATKGTMSGAVYLNSLGFVPADVLPSTSTEANGVFSLYGNLSSSVSNLTLACAEGTADFPIIKHTNSTGTGSLDVADINTTFFLRASISFRTT